MSLSLQTIGGAGQSGTKFYQQVQGALQAQVTAVLSEASNVADHSARYLAARKCEVNGASYLPQLCLAVAQQLPTTYADLTAVADADVSNAMSAIWNGFAYSIITMS